nr:MAG TPA: hypothetical protein [Caudoviricetes sp.]
MNLSYNSNRSHSTTHPPICQDRLEKKTKDKKARSAPPSSID